MNFVCYLLLVAWNLFRVSDHPTVDLHPQRFFPPLAGPRSPTIIILEFEDWELEFVSDFEFGISNFRPGGGGGIRTHGRLASTTVFPAFGGTPFNRYK